LDLQTLTVTSSTFIVISGLSLICGWYSIRRLKSRIWHRNFMLGATVCALLFLVFYVIRWANFGSKSFEGEGLWRVFYLANLVPHILLAMVVGPLAAYLIFLALLKKDYSKHRRLGRIVAPLWLYVAASGWLIYILLYHWN
jgi:putative membrane protein